MTEQLLVDKKRQEWDTQSSDSQPESVLWKPSINLIDYVTDLEGQIVELNKRTNLLEKKCENLEKEVSMMDKEKMNQKGLQIMSDKKAEELILGLISALKEKGKKTCDIIELTEELKLPVEQIFKIMRKLEKSRKVKNISN